MVKLGRVLVMLFMVQYCNSNDDEDEKKYLNESNLSFSPSEYFMEKFIQFGRELNESVTSANKPESVARFIFRNLNPSGIKINPHRTPEDIQSTFDGFDVDKKKWSAMKVLDPSKTYCATGKFGELEEWIEYPTVAGESSTMASDDAGTNLGDRTLPLVYYYNKERNYSSWNRPCAHFQTRNPLTLEERIRRKFQVTETPISPEDLRTIAKQLKAARIENRREQNKETSRHTHIPRTKTSKKKVDKQKETTPPATPKQEQERQNAHHRAREINRLHKELRQQFLNELGTILKEEKSQPPLENIEMPSSQRRFIESRGAKNTMWVDQNVEFLVEAFLDIDDRSRERLFKQYEAIVHDTNPNNVPSADELTIENLKSTFSNLNQLFESHVTGIDLLPSVEMREFFPSLSPASLYYDRKAIRSAIQLERMLYRLIQMISVTEEDLIQHAKSLGYNMFYQSDAHLAVESIRGEGLTNRLALSSGWADLG